jgi:hypothetical protein
LLNFIAHGLSYILAKENLIKEINSETENLKENDPERYNRLAKTSHIKPLQLKPAPLNKNQSNIRYLKK